MLCLLISSGAKLRRRCYKLFAIALQYGYNAAADRFSSFVPVLHCYMLHVTLRPPPLPSPPPREALTSRVSVLLRYTSHWSHGVALLHVTLRLPPLPPRLLAKRCTCCLVVFPADLCFFYSLDREKSNCSPPPSRLLTRMLPRWRMTAFLTMASPSPVPPSDRLRPLSTR